MPIGRINTFLCYLTVFLIFFIPAIDTDLGWHLRYGNYFLQTGHILRFNVLTFYLPNYLWSHSYSGYQILTASIYKFSGLLGLAVAYGLLGTLCFYFFKQLTKVPIAFALCTFALCTIFSWNVFGLGWRAQVFTFFFLILELWIFKKSGKDTKWLFILPPVFMLWTNTHGGFPVGLLLLCSRTWIQVFSKYSFKEKSLWLASVFFSGIATLINPYGFGVWAEAIKHTHYPLNTLIAEWVRPSGPMMATVVMIAATLVTLLWKQKNQQKVFYTFCILMGTILLLDAKRNTPIFALFAALASLEIFTKQLHSIEVKRIPQQLSLLILSTAICVLAVFQIPKTIRLSINWSAYCSEALVKYPCKSVDFIRANPPYGGNVFTAYEWGGFLEWQLPQYKYFVDGRMPAWNTDSGKSPYTEYLEIIQAQPGWQEKLDSYDVLVSAYKTDWLLIGSGTFLDIELQKGSGVWKEKYRDNTSVVYTKN